MKGVHNSDYAFLFALATRCMSHRLVYIKGTVAQDLLLQVFIHESSSPKPQKKTLRSLRIFSKIRGDIRNSRCITGTNDTRGKIATGTAVLTKYFKLSD
jgi:hypothetical protein